MSTKSVRLYHGSHKPHPIGEELEPRYRRTEFSAHVDADGTNVDDFIEVYRPAGAVSRMQCIFAVDNVNDLNVAGASEEFVYEIQPIGRVTKAHFGWCSVLVGVILDNGVLKENERAIALAQGYWSGKSYKRTASDPVPAVFVRES